MNLGGAGLPRQKGLVTDPLSYIGNFGADIGNSRLDIGVFGPYIGEFMWYIGKMVVFSSFLGTLVLFKVI
ncbi:hypothetical protein JNUCC1_01468 [Lentibacillus sp. JNUCC-1]|nr:hypothetical protein [Lentibacillus sp. JNUCC-1]